MPRHPEANGRRIPSFQCAAIFICIQAIHPLHYRPTHKRNDEMPRSPLARLLSYSAAYRVIAIKASIYSVLNKFFDVMPEILIGVAIDVVVRGEKSFVARWGVTSPYSQIVSLALLTLIIWISESTFEYLYSVQWQTLAQKVQHDLRMDAYRHMQSLDVAYFENHESGHLVSILGDDINQLERFLNVGANSILQVASAVVFIGSVFFWIAPDIAAVAILPIPIILWGAFKYKKIAEPLYASVREKAAIISGRLTSNIAGITTIKSFAAEPWETQKVESLSSDYVKANQNAIRVSSAFTPVIRMAVLSGFVATLILGGFKTIDGGIAVGSFGILVFLTQRLLWPFTSLAQTVDLYQRAMASCDRILNLIDTPIQTAHGTIALHRSNVRGALRFEGVTFGYSGRPSTFTDLSFEIPSGKTVALVGQTGSGKSTVAKLLLRFYEPTAGRITLDGQNISDIQMDHLRGVIGLVSQEIFLFSDTIAANIAYNHTDTSRSAITQASVTAAAHDFISALPKGYDTPVGERGQKLSGGQRQRLGLARAVLRDPPILILDEATSAVDNETERLIQESMEKIRVGRTVLVIAHRLSTIKNADLIYVMDEGRIAEQGSHDSLLARGGLYAKLWSRQ